MLEKRDYALVTIDSRKKYLDIVGILEKKTKTIALVNDFHDEEDFGILFAQDTMELLEKKRVRKWCNNRSLGTIFYFRARDVYFKYLRRLGSFFQEEDQGETRGLGSNIIFYNEKENVLFYTIYHEGFAWIQKEIWEDRK